MSMHPLHLVQKLCYRLMRPDSRKPGDTIIPSCTDNLFTAGRQQIGLKGMRPIFWPQSLQLSDADAGENAKPAGSTQCVPTYEAIKIKLFEIHAEILP